MADENGEDEEVPPLPQPIMPPAIPPVIPSSFSSTAATQSPCTTIPHSQPPPKTQLPCTTTYNAIPRSLPPQ